MPQVAVSHTWEWTANSCVGSFIHSVPCCVSIGTATTVYTTESIIQITGQKKNIKTYRVCIVPTGISLQVHDLDPKQTFTLAADCTSDEISDRRNIYLLHIPMRR